jgi:bifunctional non-homologous end joining protein LigD
MDVRDTVCDRRSSSRGAGRESRPEARLPPSGSILGNKNDVEVKLGEHRIKLTNLQKPFWPELGITKGGLIEYYLQVSEALLPHLRDRAMVMKRYPHGWQGDFFFMKRAPSPRPRWIRTCSIEHGSGNIIDFPIIQDVPALLWVINLGCIDLNQWYARCDDVDRPDYVHFDLDPVPGAGWEQVREAALLVHEALVALNMPCYPKTTGSRGIHVYVPIMRGPTQKQVWTFAKELARAVATQHPAVLTSEYKVAKRPHGRVLVDYNQNAWGRTLASVYSVRPRAEASVSTPVTWEEIEDGVRIEDFTVFNVPHRIQELGDLYAPLLAKGGRFPLEQFL